MNVHFVLRSSARTKPGGDSRKVGEYERHLAELGIESTTTFGPSQGRCACDVVHIFNLDLPLQALLSLRTVPSTAKVVLSSIHHADTGREAFFASGLDRFYRWASQAQLSFDRAACMRELAQIRSESPELLQGALRLAARARFSHRELQRAVIRRVDAVLPMCRQELESISDDISEVPSAICVPNGFSFLESSPEMSDVETARGSERADEPSVLAVGRIEPRKNSLALALAARELGVRASFVGQPNTLHRRYVAEFLEVVSSANHLHYQTAVSHTRLPHMYRRASLHASFAWFEVVSQVDLEALSLGTPIVMSRYAHLPDSVNGSPSTVSPAEVYQDPVAGAQILERALKERVQPKLESPPSWRQVSERLASAYESVLT